MTAGLSCGFLEEFLVQSVLLTLERLEELQTIFTRMEMVPLLSLQNNSLVASSVKQSQDVGVFPFVELSCHG
jgi:hypothetical protein